jgi:IS5 family transposase
MPGDRRATMAKSGALRNFPLARLEAWNQPIHRIRGRIEKVFGTWKRDYGLRRMQWRGLAKADVQIRLTAIAYNMKCSLKIITVAT